MKLYKYRSLDNLWHILDIIINQRLYCATWEELNDPLEGSYEVYRRLPGEKNLALEKTIEKGRNTYRIASLSGTPSDILLWSHYAAGHRGVALEIEISGAANLNTKEVHYMDPPSHLSGIQAFGGDLMSLFLAKPSLWAYEKEFRIISENKYVALPRPVARVFLGQNVSSFHEDILRKLFPSITFLNTYIKTGTNPASVEATTDINNNQTEREKSPPVL